MSSQEPGPSGSHSRSETSAPHSNSKSPTPASSFTLPKLVIFRPFPAWNSPQVDERCFVYCSQTSYNRARGNNPWCRTVCFRRVFGHEVHDGTYDASRDVNGDMKPQVPLPLPHEGQPRDAFDDGEIGDTDKTQYWKEGRYIWVSKSRWAAQEKLDSMMADLPKQTEWMRFKEAMERQRYEEELDRIRQQVRQSNMGQTNADEGREERNDEERNDEQQADDSQGREEPEAPPSAPPSLRFAPSSAIRDSYLVRVTPLPALLQDALHHKLTFVLTPAYKLLMVFRRSFTDGTQTRFLQKAYEQATNGSTLTLMRNVWSRHETWIKELEQRKEGNDDRKKKGGGNEVDGGDR